MEDIWRSAHFCIVHFKKIIKHINSSYLYASCTSFSRGSSVEHLEKCHHINIVPGSIIVTVILSPEERPTHPRLLSTNTKMQHLLSLQQSYKDIITKDMEKINLALGSETDLKDLECMLQDIECSKALTKELQEEFSSAMQKENIPQEVMKEEIGGHDGMAKFVATPTFKNLKVGFALDEGYANPTEKFTIFYGERAPWWVLVTCEGQPGHGSQFLPNTAGEKLQKVINLFMKFRDSEQQKLKDNPDLKLGDVTTCNLTMLKGGVQFNVVPAELSVGFDLRVAPTVDFVKFEAMIEGWCKEAGPDVTYEFITKTTIQNLTCIEDGKCVWWDTFSRVCKEENMSLVKEIFPAATDCRFIRQLGIPALGFSPMNHTPILLHDHNEYLNEKIFLRGIEIYTKIIPAIANLKNC
ncbi:unnamed protein product, partial [Meganyctiphanes norvegica]